MDHRTKVQLGVGLGAAVVLASGAALVVFDEDAPADQLTTLSGTTFRSPDLRVNSPVDLSCGMPLVPEPPRPEPLKVDGPFEPNSTVVCGCPTGEAPPTPPPVDLSFLDRGLGDREGRFTVPGESFSAPSFRTAHNPSPPMGADSVFILDDGWSIGSPANAFTRKRSGDDGWMRTWSPVQSRTDWTPAQKMGSRRTNGGTP